MARIDGALKSVVAKALTFFSDVGFTALACSVGFIMWLGTARQADFNSLSPYLLRLLTTENDLFSFLIN